MYSRMNVCLAAVMGMIMASSKANGENTPYRNFAANQDPWDCQRPADAGSDWTPSTACKTAYPAEWFPSRSDIDQRCVTTAPSSCIGNPNDSNQLDGCLMVGSVFGSAPSFGASSAFCVTQTSLGTPFVVGAVPDYDKGTPSDPFGRCSNLNSIVTNEGPEPELIFIWCGEIDERPATTTPDPLNCECGVSNGRNVACKYGEGQCMYDGVDGQIVFERQCASYYKDTGACFEGFEDSDIITTDCCADVLSTATPTTAENVNKDFCPASICKEGSGPCIFSYTEDPDEGENICINYMVPSAELCYPQSLKCTEIRATIPTISATDKPTPVTVDPGTTGTPGTPGIVGDDYNEYCDTCYGDTKGPCRSLNVVPDTGGQYVCLGYLPGTDQLRNQIVYGDASTGPQCMETTTKCTDPGWTSSTITTLISTTSVTTTTRTTSTVTTTTARRDPATDEVAVQLNLLINGWEQVYCAKPNDADAVAIHNNGIVVPSLVINEAMIRAWMTQGHHSEAQDELQADRLPEEVGAGLGESVCPDGPGQSCTCHGLVRRSVKPSISWGDFNCTADTFQSLAVPFEPALNNGDGNCYCTENNVDYEHVRTSKQLMELARAIGAARRCQAGKSTGPADTATIDGVASFGPGVDGASPAFVNTACSRECRSDQDKDLVAMMNAAGIADRRNFLEKKTKELEDAFEYIFRFNTNDVLTVYNEFEVAAVSDGLAEFRQQHEAYAVPEVWQAFRDKIVPATTANERFESAAFDVFGETFLAVGQLHAASSQKGCFPGNIKNVLGLCACATEQEQTSSSTSSTSTTLTGVPTTVTATTTPPTTEDPFVCVLQWKGPLKGFKFKFSDKVIRNKRIDTIRGLDNVVACATLCLENKDCKEFGWKEQDETEVDARTSCLVYNDFLFSKDELEGGSPFDHYYYNLGCKTAMLAPTSTSSTQIVPTGAPSESTTVITATVITATTTTVTDTYGKTAETNATLIVGSECLVDKEVNHLEFCKARCAAQHECVGIMYYFDPSDDFTTCENKRKESIDTNSNDAFDRMEVCSLENDGKCQMCGDQHTCVGTTTNNVTSYACTPCITSHVKSNKCDSLYNIGSAADKAHAGDSAQPVIMCSMLTSFCAYGSDCVRLVEEDLVRSVSFEQKIISEQEQTTATSTATSTAASTATTTATSTLVTTVTTTAVSTPSTTGGTTASSTASMTQISSQTTTVTTTDSATAISTQTTTAVSTVTTTATATDASSATSTQITTPSSTQATTPSTTQTTTGSSTPITSTSTTITTSTTSTTTITTTTGAFQQYKVAYETFPNGLGRRFGNAFDKNDRRFHVKYDKTSQMGYKGGILADGSIEGAGSACQARCTEDPLCLAIFVWNQLDHVPLADRTNMEPGTKTGYSCAGLTSANVYGNFASYDNYFGNLNAAELALAYSVVNTTLTQEEDPLISDLVNGFKGSSLSIVKQFVWNKAGTNKGPCTQGKVNGNPYNGACLHEETGFCMEEIPGTAQCMDGFVHRGTLYIDYARENEL